MEDRKIKNKKILITLLLVIGLLSITIGVSVAFFNYTRTGTESDPYIVGL